MTCNDCKNRRNCHYWCKDTIFMKYGCSSFESKYKTHHVKKHGLLCEQFGSTHEVIIYDGFGAVLYHQYCEKRKSRFALRKILNNYLREKENER